MKNKNLKTEEKAVFQQVAPASTSSMAASSGETLSAFTMDKSVVVDDTELVKMEGLRQKVFLDRYALRAKNGELIEKTPEEMWKRVAWGIAQAEKTKDRKEWEQRFYGIMKGFKFVPGGRILSGAGTGYEVTYFNCFVIPSPKDSRQGILDSLKQLVEIQSRSGGVGLNLSSLRPKGARVKKVNGFSSGPVTWAGLFSYATHDVVQQGGSRRGATMLMLWDWHPDIEEFITVKQDLTKIHGANLSVCISDEFMAAVKEDKDWSLVYPDLDDPHYDEWWNGELDDWKAKGGTIKVYKTVKARELWDMICTAAWRSAEPGLHFLERSNKRSNTYYFEKLVATNPCLTSDTWIHTNKGPRQVKDLISTPFLARVNGKDYLSGSNGFFKTGTKKVLRVKTRHGYILRLTGNHLVKRVTKHTRYALESEWVEAGKLKSGDKLVLHDHRGNDSWDGSYTFNQGYLMGLLVGDGTVKTEKAVLSVWQSKVEAKTGYQSIMQHAYSSALSLPHRNDFTGWIEVPDRGEYRLSTAAITSLAKELNISKGQKTITPAMERASSSFSQGFLRGLFDADGSVQGTQAKGVSVRLAQSDLVLLQAAQRMLLRLGIVSSIYENRRTEGKKRLPNGKGAYSVYSTKAQHELVISGENLIRFDQLIGFSDNDKLSRLHLILRRYNRSLNRERFVTEVENISSDGEEDVYDVQIPGINAFDANGLYVHNCGEQPLGPWAVCNLGSMNLAAYVSGGQFDFDSFGKDVQVGMRFMDNVIDQTYYFFPENEKTAKEIRRTGLGIMGLADALIKMEVRYGSEESLPVIRKIFQTLRDNAYEASSDIAKEKGSFPKFDAEKFLQGYHVRALPEGIREKIRKQGIRNGVLLTVAPTGTISVIAGASSGLEPVYEFSYLQRWRGGEDIVYHPLFDAWRKANPDKEKPPFFASANDLTPLEHVKVQAIAQEFIDSSISKTVNAPNVHTVDDVKSLYMSAYDLGLKGITYMRDGSRQGVLERVDDKKRPEVVVAPKPIHRPMVLRGRTYKIATPVGEGFITINRDEKDQPFEAFITISKGGSHVMADAEALGRMISLTLRCAGDNRKEVARKIVAQLRGIGGSSHIGFGKERVTSLADAVGKVLAEDLSLTDLEKPEQEPLKLEEPQEAVHTNGLNPNGLHTNGLAKVVDMPGPVDGQMPMLSAEENQAQKHGDLCPECGNSTLVAEEGCHKCYNCGYSKC